MHELGMCEDVLHAVEQRAQGRRVEAIGVRTGAFLMVVPDAFRQSFALVAGGSVADGAAVNVTLVPAAARCHGCGEGFEASETFPVCPTCDGVDVEVTGGDELTLEWLRYSPGPDSDVHAPTGAEADP